MDHRRAPVPSQLSLGGIAPALPTDRLFFALFPDPETTARIAALTQSLRNEHGLRGKAMHRDRLHVTLHHLGDHAGIPPDLVVRAGQAAAQVVMRAFEVGFDSASSFAGRPGNRPCVLRGEQGLGSLVAMQRQLGTCMQVAGLSQWVGRDFTPHVTLLYDAQGIAPRPVESVSWTAREFVLVHSELRQSRYHVLGRWLLQA